MFQGGDGAVHTMEQAVSSQPVPVESESNTDNMENSSPGKICAAFKLSRKHTYLSIVYVCVDMHIFLNDRRVGNNWITLAQCSATYLIATAVVLHSPESI